MYDDPKIYDDMLHGDKTKNSDHVTDCIKGGNHSGVGYFLNSYKEEKYARNQREPLGKSIIRNYKFPDKVTETEFKFGIPTGGCKFKLLQILKIYNQVFTDNLTNIFLYK